MTNTSIDPAVRLAAIEACVRAALHSFERDPADRDYQRGYGAALRELASDFGIPLSEPRV